MVNTACNFYLSFHIYRENSLTSIFPLHTHYSILKTFILVPFLYLRYPALWGNGIYLVVRTRIHTFVRKLQLWEYQTCMGRISKCLFVPLMWSHWLNAYRKFHWGLKKILKTKYLFEQGKWVQALIIIKWSIISWQHSATYYNQSIIIRLSQGSCLGDLFLGINTPLRPPEVLQHTERLS